MNVRKQLPARARVDQLKKQAKDLLAELRAGAPDALERVRSSHPRFARTSAPAAATAKLLLADTQLVVAREYGFANWTKLRARVQAIDLADPVTAFLEAASAPLDGDSHASGTLDRADAILAEHPRLAAEDVYVAALLGDEEAVRRFLDRDGHDASATGGLYDWDALTYLCFSRYLRLDAGRADAFVRTARLLLERGATATTGFFSHEHEPDPCFETAIYGAAAVAKHAELTRLLLAHGADPNDGETPYHVPEGYDDAALRVLVESGKVDRAGLTTMLHRKHDWHHYDAIVWLLAHGADPNELSLWGKRALHQSLERDNDVRFVELLLDHGADPALPCARGRSAVVAAARMGRADVLETFARRGFASDLHGGDAFLAACARGDSAAARALVAQDPRLVAQMEAEFPERLADVAGTGNTAAVTLMLDLGFDVGSRTKRAGASRDTALHAAIWRGRHETARLLIARRAPLEVTNDSKETPLAYAVRAVVESEWTRERSAETVKALIAAGARVEAVKRFPSGFEEVDAELRRAGRE